MRIWTECYRPFRVGGNPHTPIIADVPVTGPFNIGKGQSAYVAISPSGKTFVAESDTGALVGPTIEAVRNDVLSCKDDKIMKEQIKEARKRVKQAEPVSPDTFWKLLRAD